MSKEKETEAASSINSGLQGMSLVYSRQKEIFFVICNDAVLLDKSIIRGPGNDQFGPSNFSYMKISTQDNGQFFIEHIVQADQDKSTPLGREQGNTINTFNKKPIWVDEKRPLSPGEKITLETKDGMINYEVKEISFYCYNDINGKPDLQDVRIQTLESLEKSYYFDK